MSRAEGGLREPASGQIGSFGRGQKLQTPVSPVFLCTLFPAFYFSEPHYLDTFLLNGLEINFCRKIMLVANSDLFKLECAL